MSEHVNIQSYAPYSLQFALQATISSDANFDSDFNVQAGCR